MYGHSHISTVIPFGCSSPQSKSAGFSVHLPLLQVEVITGESLPQWMVIRDPSEVAAIDETINWSDGNSTMGH